MNPVPWEFEIVTLKSGVFSLRSVSNRETFHPVVGPMIEARTLHVRAPRLLERAQASGGKFIVWDVGLGAAANALAVREACLECLNLAGGSLDLELHSFDETAAPLEFALAHHQELGYLAAHQSALKSLLREGLDHSVPGFRWQLHLGDFRQWVQTASLPAPHAIIYDPYSAKANPGMWSLEHFEHLRQRLAPQVPCLLTNYTKSTAIRVTLLLAGFFVGRGSGVGEKDETTVASNTLELLESPLEIAWLDRVRFSTRGAPLRPGTRGLEISPQDLAALEAHPQFQLR
jgi:tRNA U34 5-methylaminomethyl-2-thiouridine-forming methyltransferase MnmC